MSRQAKKQLPTTPIEFPRANPAELDKFDPSTKICTMNCGQHTDDSRSPAECKLLCDDCLRSIPKQPVPVSADILNDSLRDMARDSGLPVEWWQKQPSREWRELSEFARKVTERERAARQAAQVENESLKARLARAGMEQRKAVLEEREACARICDTTPPEPFRPSIEAAHAIRARSRA